MVPYKSSQAGLMNISFGIIQCNPLCKDEYFLSYDDNRPSLQSDYPSSYHLISMWKYTQPIMHIAQCLIIALQNT